MGLPIPARRADGCIKKHPACTQARRTQSMRLPYLPALLRVCTRCGIWHQASAGCRDVIGPVPRSLVIRFAGVYYMPPRGLSRGERKHSQERTQRSKILQTDGRLMHADPIFAECYLGIKSHQGHKGAIALQSLEDLPREPASCFSIIEPSNMSFFVIKKIYKTHLLLSWWYSIEQRR